MTNKNSYYLLRIKGQTYCYAIVDSGRLTSK